MKSLKVRLNLNNKQETLAFKHAGVARHAYNWGLETCQKAYKNKEAHLSAIDLHKKLVKEVKSIHPWYYEVSKCAPQQALRDLGTAYKRFFKKIGKHPRFKKKGQHNNFYLEGKIVSRKGKIKLPRFGWVRLSEQVELDNIKNVTIARHAKHWFVSFLVPHEPKATPKTREAVGVDLGIKTLATLSDGKIFENKRPYKTYKRKLKIAQRVLSKRFVKGKKIQSNNYYKQQTKVAQIHYKIACIRKDALHKLTSYLAKNHSHIVIEDLNVAGMVKNHRLASAILDGGFYEFKRQLEYKSKWYGSTLKLANRFYPSSKLCSNCGNKKGTLKLSERVYNCQNCQISIDRDLNASLNLEKLAESYPASACGGLIQPKASALGSPEKQEVNSKLSKFV